MLLSTETYEFLLIKNNYSDDYSDFSVSADCGDNHPLLAEGDILLVKKQDSVSHDEIGVFIIDGIRTVKKMFFKNGIIGFKSLAENAEELPIEDVENIICEGKAIKVLHAGECAFHKI